MIELRSTSMSNKALRYSKFIFDEINSQTIDCSDLLASCSPPHETDFIVILVSSFPSIFCVMLQLNFQSHGV